MLLKYKDKYALFRKITKLTWEDYFFLISEEVNQSIKLQEDLQDDTRNNNNN